MQPIATTTLSSPSLSITFSNISGDYTDLVLMVVPKTTQGTAQMCFTLNNDTGSNYGISRMGGNGSTTGFDAPSNVAFGQLSWWGYMGSTEGQILISHFMNYSNTTMNKTVICRNANAAYGTGTNINSWRNTAAITTIRIYSDALDLATGTTATLYGIRAA